MFTNTHEARVLDELFEATRYIGLHFAAQIVAGAGDENGAGDGKIRIDRNPALQLAGVAGSGKLIVDRANGAQQETLYAGSVTDNEDDTYTVTLVDAEGDPAVLANTHAVGVFVQFDPGRDLASLNEPAAGAYDRVAEDGTKFAAAVVGNPSSMTNSADVTFPTASADWGWATHYVLLDADTGTTGRDVAELTAAKLIQSGDSFKLSSGQVVIKLGASTDTF